MAKDDKKKRKNPLTKSAEANTFTNVEGRDLPEPTNVRAVVPPSDPYEKMVINRGKKRLREYKRNRVGKTLEVPEFKGIPGYEKIDIDDPTWFNPDLEKAMPSLKVPTGPAINEPKSVHPQMPVLRRAEDLSGDEYKKGLDFLKMHGLTHRDVVEFVKDSYKRASVRAAIGGDTKLAGSGFYAGPTDIRDKFDEVTEAIKSHPNFKGDHMDALAISAAAHSATSPKTPVKSSTGYPNSEAALAAVMHGLSDKPIDEFVRPGGLMGTTKNIVKAARMVRELNSGTAKLPDLFTEYKTAGFAGGQMDVHNPSSIQVSDIHSANTRLPHLSSSISKKFNIQDKDGNLVTHIGEEGDSRPISHLFDAEDIGKNGLPKPSLAKKRLAHYGLTDGHKYVPQLDNTGKQVLGGSPVERVLSKGGNILHALFDHATRIAAHELGLTPSPAHAQATHPLQEVDWQDRRILRPDLPYSMDTEHPGWREKLGMPGNPMVSQQFQDIFKAGSQENR